MENQSISRVSRSFIPIVICQKYMRISEIRFRTQIQSFPVSGLKIANALFSIPQWQWQSNTCKICIWTHPRVSCVVSSGMFLYHFWMKESILHAFHILFLLIGSFGSHTKELIFNWKKCYCLMIVGLLLPCPIFALCIFHLFRSTAYFE